VGRSRDSSLRVKSDEISRRHAVLTVSEGKVRLKDVGSTNHSFVDGNIIKEEVEIKVGMLLGFGKIEGKLVLKDCAQ
jgi:pSer/pThr/pTyr-binding forkhead associated (FHA) protein